MINVIINFLNSEDNFTGPVNLGNPEEYKIISLAKKIIELTNSKSQLKFLPLPDDDPKKRKPNISLAKAKLNWLPDTNLEKGLIKTINYFKSIV